MEPLTLQQFTFGHELQGKLVALLLRDGSFCDRWMATIKSDYIVNSGLRTILELIYDYFRQYRQPPTVPVLYELVKTARHGANDLAQWVDWLAVVTIVEQDYIEERVRQFVQTQEYMLAAMEIAKDIQQNKFDGILRRVQQAEERVSLTYHDHGIHLFDAVRQGRASFEQTFQTAARTTIPTWLPTVNQYTGGIGKKELTVVAAPAGKGKTFVLINLAAPAVTLGKNVVLVSLEMSAEMIRNRICSAYTGVLTTHIESEAGKEYTYQVLSNLAAQGGNLAIYRFSSYTVSMLRSLLTQLRAQWGHIDVVGVDYADLLMPVTSEDQKRTELANIYRDLRRIAIDLDCGVVTPSQTNRSSLAKKIITNAELSECYEKAAIADVIWALCQTEDEEKAHRARLFLSKNRNEQGGIIIPLTMQLHTARIVEDRYGQPAT